MANGAIPKPLEDFVKTYGGRVGSKALNLADMAGLVPKDFDNNYIDYLNNVGVLGNMSELQKRVIDRQVDLAKNINAKYFGMDPLKAQRSAVKNFSPGRLGANFLLDQYGINDALQSMYQSMNKSGVFAPVINAPNRDLIVANNTKIRNLFSVPLNNAVNFDKFKDMDPRDYADLFTKLFDGGAFNKHLSDPRYFTNTGEITQEGVKAVDSLINDYKSAAKAFKKLPFMRDKSSAQVIMDTSKLLGGDPVYIFGKGKQSAGQVIDNLMTTAKAYNVNDSDTLGVIERMAELAKGRNIDNSLIPAMADTYFRSAGMLKEIDGSAGLGGYLQNAIQNKFAEYNEDGVLDTANAGMKALVEYGGVDPEKAKEMMSHIIHNPNAANNKEIKMWIKGTVNTALGDTVLTDNTIPALLSDKQQYTVMSSTDALNDIKKDVNYSQVKKRINDITGGLDEESWIRSHTRPADRLAAKTRLKRFYGDAGKAAGLQGTQYKALLSALGDQKLPEAKRQAIETYNKAMENAPQMTKPGINEVLQGISSEQDTPSLLDLARRYLRVDAPQQRQDMRGKALIDAAQKWGLQGPVKGLFGKNLPDDPTEFTKGITEGLDTTSVNNLKITPDTFNKLTDVYKMFK